MGFALKSLPPIIKAPWPNPALSRRYYLAVIHLETRPISAPLHLEATNDELPVTIHQLPLSFAGIYAPACETHSMPSEHRANWLQQTQFVFN